MTTGDNERAAVDNENTITPKSLEVMIGVVFGKSIRSHYAILHVAMNIENAAPPSHDYAVVLVEFLDNPSVSPTDMRSWCRRSCKLGDEVEFKGQWVSRVISTSRTAHETKQQRSFVVKAASMENDLMKVTQVRHWSMPQCQEWQQQYRPKVVSDEHPTKKRVKVDNKNDSTKDHESLRHGGNKRDQGECIANFVIHVMIQSIQRNDSGSEGYNNQELHDKAIEALNQGSGVMDAAGGSGYVSMALGRMGIKSTVVDPRESVGKLPRRDRKVWNRLLRGVPNRNDDGVLVCQPVIPYDSLRAWFAKPPPEDVDTSFRHGDVESIPVCGEERDLLRNCSAIVALHPDEATDAIVDIAVRRRIPFVVVPCCVFSRFFSYRRKVGTNLPVTTHQDLLDYLATKDESIQRATLPFEGANVALWSVF